MHSALWVKISASFLLANLLFSIAGCKSASATQNRDSTQFSSSGSTATSDLEAQTDPSIDEARDLLQSSDLIVRRPVSYTLSTAELSCLTDAGVFVQRKTLTGGTLGLTAKGARYFSSQPVLSGTNDRNPVVTVAVAPAYQPRPRFRNLEIARIWQSNPLSNSLRTVTFRGETNDGSIPQEIESCLPARSQVWSGIATIHKENGVWRVTYLNSLQPESESAH